MQSGETCSSRRRNDPSLRHVKGELINRRVKSDHRRADHVAHGRHRRDFPAHLPRRAHLLGCGCALRAGCAALTAQSLRNAHRYERLAQRTHEFGDQLRHMELERVALLAFFRRLLDAFGGREARGGSLLPKASADSWTAWSACHGRHQRSKGGEAGSTRR